MSDFIKAGSYVQIHGYELKPEQRTGKIPDDTRNVPFEMWVKGFLNSDAKLHDNVVITTVTGREVCGELVDVNPIYNYGFGRTFVPELLQVGLQVREIVRGEK